MRGGPVTFSVFTKPWRVPLTQLGPLVKGLGFDGVELPVRPGYQVEPAEVARGLPAAARTLASAGVTIGSVAGPLDLPTIAACADAGVPLIRVCIPIPLDRSYLEVEAQVQRAFDALLPALEDYGVAIGVQNHCDRFIATAMGVRHLIERYDPRLIGAVWDPAHCALGGELPELALDILWSHLHLVNLKNAYWSRADRLDEDGARFERIWTSGRQGLCSWPTVAAALHGRGYGGAVCLTAEYTDEAAVHRLIAEDLSFARSLFPGTG